MQSCALLVHRPYAPFTSRQVVMSFKNSGDMGTLAIGKAYASVPAANQVRAWNPFNDISTGCCCRSPVHEDGAQAWLANACPVYCSTPAEECVLRGHRQDGGPVSRWLLLPPLLLPAAQRACVLPPAKQSWAECMRCACAAIVHPPAPSVPS